MHGSSRASSLHGVLLLADPSLGQAGHFGAAAFVLRLCIKSRAFWSATFKFLKRFKLPQANFFHRSLFLAWPLADVIFSSAFFCRRAAMFFFAFPWCMCVFFFFDGRRRHSLVTAAGDCRGQMSQFLSFFQLSLFFTFLTVVVVDRLWASVAVGGGFWRGGGDPW